MGMHAPDMVFHNHTAGRAHQGEDVRGHLQSIFETWPDLHFETRRLYVRDGLVVQEWTAIATHSRPCAAGTSLRSPRSARCLGRHGRDPIRGRPRETQGRLLGLGLDPAPGRACWLNRTTGR